MAGISFITTLTAPQKSNRGRPHRGSRCVGYLKNKKEAVKLVEANAGDINENGTYPLCVIETLSEGIYPIANALEWFAWDESKKGYARIEGPPEDLLGVVCFSIG